MDRTTVLIGGAVLIVVIGGLFLYNMQGSATSPGTTTITTSTGDTDQTVARTPGAPIAVTNVAASPTDTTAFVAGMVTPNGAFTTYWYEFGTTGSLGNKTTSQSIGSGYVAIGAPAYITNLAKETTYYYRLVAENQLEKVAGAQYSFKTTSGISAPVGNIPSVQTLTATNVLPDSVNLNGEVSPNGASTVDWFEYGTTADLGNISASASVGSGGGKVTASIALVHLKPAVKYYFRLNAQNQFGTVNGQILTFTTAAAAVSTTAPTAATRSANAITASTATLRGSVNPHGIGTNYWFEYSTSMLSSSVVPSTTAQTNAGVGVTQSNVEMKVDSLASGATYYFRIVAQSSEGVVRGDTMTFMTQ